MPNFVWIETGDSAPGTISYSSGKREVDCFDYLAVQLNFSGGVSTTTLAVNWYDNLNNLLFTDLVTLGPGTQEVFEFYDIKGQYAEIVIDSPSSGGSFVFNLFAKLVIL